MWNFFSRLSTSSLLYIRFKANLIKKVYFPSDIMVISKCTTASLMSLFESVVLLFLWHYSRFPFQSISRICHASFSYFTYWPGSVPYTGIPQCLLPGYAIYLDINSADRIFRNTGDLSRKCIPTVSYESIIIQPSGADYISCSGGHVVFKSRRLEHFMTCIKHSLHARISWSGRSSAAGFMLIAGLTSDR